MWCNNWCDYTCVYRRNPFEILLDTVHRKFSGEWNDKECDARLSGFLCQGTIIDTRMDSISMFYRRAMLGERFAALRYAFEANTGVGGT